MANFRGGGRRMAKQWVALAATPLALTASATAIGGSLVATEAFTVLRMIGEYIISPTSAPTAGDQTRVIVGIGVVSADALAVGASAMPDPGAEAEYPWLYWADHPFFFNSTALGGSGDGPIEGRYEYDIKSMRKLKPREALVLVVEYSNITGNPPLTFISGQTRVLTAE